MKKTRTLLAMILALSVLLSTAIAAAEMQNAEVWQADIHKLMNEASIPRTTSILFDYAVSGDAALKDHSMSVEKVNGEGIALRIDVDASVAEGYTKEELSALNAWLNDIVSDAIQGIAVDTESIANVSAEAISNARSSADVSAMADIPVWARDDWYLSEIKVTLPYYPELTTGVNGSATKKLQEELIRLGFLNDSADGYYGEKTKQAVEMLEQHVRSLEQKLIDEQPEVTAAPTPVPAIGVSAEETMAVPEDIPITPEPTVTPAPTPATPVDGVADALLQAYLYSDEFVSVQNDLSSGDRGNDVLRLQNRLLRLGCMVGSADGEFGGATARSVRIFQYYNGLEQTGVADAATQRLIYSERAQTPENPMLSAGSTGDAVRELQLRLRVLGFMDGSVDGDYGKTTVNGVSNLQQYMRDLEEIEIRADDAKMTELSEAGKKVSDVLTVEINGIADPILLDDFYADTFPAMPAPMQSGSSGIDVVRLQRRLNCLEYYFGSLDGDYGAGSQKAVKNFQKRHGLEQTGIADAATLDVLFSDKALKALKPYVLKISTADQRVYAYGLDSNNEYTVLVRTMKCSTGKNETPTPKGTFQNGTGPGARWHYFKKFKCWAQYAYYIDGDIMFHSVLYNKKDGPVTQSSVNNLGRKASHGCVRLSVEDAKWVYNNCPVNTKIIVY